MLDKLQRRQYCRRTQLDMGRATGGIPKLQMARTADAPAIASLRTAAAATLTLRHGQGPWSVMTTERGVLFSLRNASVLVVRRGGQVIATLTLTAKKPWAIDRRYFTTCARPIYLTSMAVAPGMQSQGVGRHCLAGAVERVRQMGGDAIFLDAYDAAAGAGEFYRKCGFREVGRVSYRQTPLIYFELLLGNP